MIKRCFYGKAKRTHRACILHSAFTAHSYARLRHYKKLTNGRVNIGAGTLYGAINTLLSKGFIAEHKSDPSKKEYIITEEGRAILSAELSRLKELVKNGEEILEGTND